MWVALHRASGPGIQAGWLCLRESGVWCNKMCQDGPRTREGYGKGALQHGTSLSGAGKKRERPAWHSGIGIGSV